MTKETLTPKQHRFCIEYLKDRNGKEAAIRAGYSPNAAAQQAYELLKLPKVRLMIDAEQQDSLDRVRVDADWIKRRLKEEAEDMDNSGGERIRALELLGKHEGMFIERKEVKHEHHAFFANVDLNDPIPLDAEFEEVPALPAPSWDMTEPDDAGEE